MWEQRDFWSGGMSECVCGGGVKLCKGLGRFFFLCRIYRVLWGPDNMPVFYKSHYISLLSSFLPVQVL